MGTPTCTSMYKSVHVLYTLLPVLHVQVVQVVLVHVNACTVGIRYILQVVYVYGNVRVQVQHVYVIM